jgi:hypothetical protein
MTKISRNSIYESNEMKKIAPKLILTIFCCCLTSVDAWEAFPEVNERWQSSDAPFASVFGISDFDKSDVQVIDFLINSFKLS